MSTISVDQVTPSAGGTATDLVSGLAKAWINFNGSGTIAIRDSLNVTSITDAGTGDYHVTFTNAFTDANYSPVMNGSRDSAGSTDFKVMVLGNAGNALSAGQVNDIRCATNSNAATDASSIWMPAHGDLA